MSDLADLSGLRRDDAEAFAALFNRHAATVFRYAHAVIGDRQHSEDVLQETFLTLWSRRADLEVYGDSVLPWLLVTARNHTRNLGRRLLRRATALLAEADDIDAWTDPADVVAHRVVLEAIVTDVAQLSVTDRSLVTLCLVGDTPYAEAATKVGLTTAVTARRVQRIRTRLKTAGR